MQGDPYTQVETQDQLALPAPEEQGQLPAPEPTPEQGLLPPGQGFELTGEPYEGVKPDFVDELINAVAEDAVTLQIQEDAKRLAQQRMLPPGQGFELQDYPDIPTP